METRVVFLTEPGKIEIEKISLPALKSNQVLIKTQQASICGSERYYYRGITVNDPIPISWFVTFLRTPVIFLCGEKLLTGSSPSFPERSQVGHNVQENRQETEDLGDGRGEEYRIRTPGHHQGAVVVAFHHFPHDQS
jgi:hypothetical protein